MTDHPTLEVPTAKDLKVPKWLLAQVQVTPSGRKRDPIAVAWFFRFLETGEATQSVIDVGWKGGQPSWKAHHLKQQFAHLLSRAIKYRRTWSEAKALRLLDYAMELGLDPKLNKDPRVITNALKAADSVLDRGDMPKGARLRGLDTAPEEEKEEVNTYVLIDRLVETVGIEAVRAMKGVADYKAHRDYLEEKWPLLI
ncbi:MAG: hypothetical protein V3S64_12665 [bacterium]